MINLTLIAALCIIYVVRTYQMCLFDSKPIWKYFANPDRSVGGWVDMECPANQQGEAETWYTVLLLITHSYFLGDYIFRAIVTKYYFKFLLTFDSVVEIFTTVPLLLLYLINGGAQNSEFKFIMIGQARLYLFKRYTKNIASDNKREMLDIMFLSLANLIFYTVLLQHVENQYLYENELEIINASFFDNFFFVATTVSIVGYGSDIMATQSKIIVILIIVIVWAPLPENVSRFVALLNSKSRYAKLVYPVLKDVPHVILIGSVSISSLENFLEEYLHVDHDDGIRHCILLMPKRPDPATELLLMKPKYMQSLIYIEGSTQDNQALNRVKLEKSGAVVILSDKFAYDAENEDTKTILEAMIIKKYINQMKKKASDDRKRLLRTPNWLSCFANKEFETIETNVCMQLLRHESITHYELSLSKEETKNDQIICIESLKLSMLAKSCLCPGLVILITNLIKSSSPPETELDKQKDDPNFSWLNDYWKGKGFEIYRVEIPYRHF